MSHPKIKISTINNFTKKKSMKPISQKKNGLFFLQKQFHEKKMIQFFRENNFTKKKMFNFSISRKYHFWHYMGSKIPVNNDEFVASLPNGEFRASFPLYFARQKGVHSTASKSWMRDFFGCKTSRNSVARRREGYKSKSRGLIGLNRSFSIVPF